MINTNLVEVAKNTIKIEIKALFSGIENINDSFINIIDEIENKSKEGKVVVLGMGKSGHIGKKIAATLASTGTTSFFVHPAEAGHGDLGMITKKDLVLTISQSGKSEEILKLIPYFKRNGIINICMTGDLDSPMAKLANYVINTHVTQEACPLGLAPTSSTTLTLALGDALAICLLTKKGYSKEEFGITHPSGSLGKKILLTIRDVMSPIHQSPYVMASADLKHSIYTMSSKGLGFVIIIDDCFRPIGVFTDGDLRRSFEREIDINNTFISDLMSVSCTIINENILCMEAVKIMSDKNITMLPVVNSEGKLTGAINIRHLLQAGVI